MNSTDPYHPPAQAPPDMERSQRLQAIKSLMSAEFDCDQGLVVELASTELHDAELQVLEKVVQHCQAGLSPAPNPELPPAHPQQAITVATFFWSEPHTLSEAQFHRAQHIHNLLIAALRCSAGGALEHTLAELDNTELSILEQILQRCQDARAIEAAEERSRSNADRIIDAFNDIAG